MFRTVALGLVSLICTSIASSQSPGTLPNTQAPPDPVLKDRPPAKPAGAAPSQARIHLDAVVDDAQGKPVTGLQPWDFELLDSDRPEKIVYFRAYDAAANLPNPPVEVILLFDELNISQQQRSFARSQITQFLRQNGGHLSHPVTIAHLSDAGLTIQPRPSTDGLALARLLAGIKGTVNTLNGGMGADGNLERFRRSLRQVEAIAVNESQKPGRKLLIWVGPGWPILNSPNFSFNEKDRRNYFDAIVELTNHLREARMEVDSVSAVDPDPYANSTAALLYKDYLKGVPTARQADTGFLGLRVLAAETGGRILGPDNDLVSQMNQCVTDADTFYELWFTPPAATHADEFHALKLGVRKPGLTVHSTIAYYNEPPGH
jgi:VWFA-related protein